MADARRMGKSELFSHFAERFEVKRTQAREPTLAMAHVATHVAHAVRPRKERTPSAPPDAAAPAPPPPILPPSAREQAPRRPWWSLRDFFRCLLYACSIAAAHL